MILHVFNCDNDMALASNSPGYTPPISITRMMDDMALLPTRWAKHGDGVLCIDHTEPTMSRVWIVDTPSPKTEDWTRLEDIGQGSYTTIEEVLPTLTEIRPWGWSHAIRHRLMRAGIPEHLLPSKEQIEAIRQLSSREKAVEMLARLTSRHFTDTSNTESTQVKETKESPNNKNTHNIFVGESRYCRTEEEVEHLLSVWGKTILKAPWSGSGKGLRYGQGGREDTLAGWYRRIISQQGGVVVEPFYNKTADFAMEFFCEKNGEVKYKGLSVFENHPNGTYSSNRLWSEEEKMQWLSGYAPLEAITFLQKELETQLSLMIGNTYHGPLGVDMMVVDGRYIHPCVEINLRTTMGYVALPD